MENLTKNFTFEELIASAKAQKYKIDNIPSPQKKRNLKTLCEQVLQPIRDVFGSAIIVTSGYRCPILNLAVKGAINSQHMQGEAADIKAANGKNRELFMLIEHMIKTGQIKTGQVIWEEGNTNKPKWIHISLPGRHLNQILFNY